MRLQWLRRGFVLIILAIILTGVAGESGVASLPFLFSAVICAVVAIALNGTLARLNSSSGVKNNDKSCMDWRKER